MVSRKCNQRNQLKQGHCHCECLRKIDPKRNFRENIKDMANSIIDVMVICGIPEYKAKSTRHILMKALKNYDEVRYRVDEMPKKILRKEHLLYDLSYDCGMTLLDGQIVYSIAKRAFKAFYYGTSGQYGVQNPRLTAQMVHTQECLWTHAAKRTAQIYAEYEGMFFPVQKKIEESIKGVYKEFYMRMKERLIPVVISTCCCQSCLNKNDSLSETKMEEKSTSSIIDEVSINLPDSLSSLHLRGSKRKTKRSDQRSKYIDLEEKTKEVKALPNCNCKCPKLTSDCVYEKGQAGIVSHECSQGPFKVRWIPVNDDYKLEPCIKTKRDRKRESQIDCDDWSEMDLENTELSSSGVCEGEIEIICEEAGAELSVISNDISLPTPPPCSFEMPIPDYTPIMLDCRKICECKDLTSLRNKSRTSSHLISGESTLTGKSTDNSTRDHLITSKEDPQKNITKTLHFGDDLLILETPDDGLLRKRKPMGLELKVKRKREKSKLTGEGDVVIIYKDDIPQLSSNKNERIGEGDVRNKTSEDGDMRKRKSKKNERTGEGDEKDKTDEENVRKMVSENNKRNKKKRKSNAGKSDKSNQPDEPKKGGQVDTSKITQPETETKNIDKNNDPKQKPSKSDKTGKDDVSKAESVSTVISNDPTSNKSKLVNVKDHEYKNKISEPDKSKDADDVNKLKKPIGVNQKQKKNKQTKSLDTTQKPLTSGSSNVKRIRQFSPHKGQTNCRPNTAPRNKKQVSSNGKMILKSPTCKACIPCKKKQKKVCIDTGIIQKVTLRPHGYCNVKLNKCPELSCFR